MASASPESWGSAWAGAGPGVFRTTVGPLLLLVCCPSGVQLMAHTVRNLDGSLSSLLSAARADPSRLLEDAFPAPTLVATTFLVGLLLLQLALLVAVPGPAFSGPRAPSGHVPIYTDNGFSCLWCSLAVLGSCTANGVLPATLIFDELLPIMSTLNISALLLSALLYVKGLRCPSTRDAGSSGHLVMDVYWGTELYPRVWGVDLKQLFIARYGIVLWMLFAVSFGAYRTAPRATVQAHILCRLGRIIVPLGIT